jgi:hypothetical protein
MIPAHFLVGTTFTHSSRFRPASRKPGGRGRGRVAVLFLDGTTFPHSFPARPAPREPGDRARRDALHFFSREPVFLIPSGSDLSLGAGVQCTFISREPVFLIPSGWDRKPWKPRDPVRRSAVHVFSREPLFLIPFGSRAPLAAPDFSSSSSSSSSPQRDSGILAVRKTGASVLRLLPPTS